MDTKQLVAGLTLALAGIAAFLALVISGNADQVDKLVAFVGPSIAALLIIGNQARQHQDNQQRLDQQDQKLTKIDEQTNGVLTKRIQDAVKAANAELLQSQPNPAQRLP